MNKNTVNGSVKTDSFLAKNTPKSIKNPARQIF